MLKVTLMTASNNNEKDLLSTERRSFYTNYII